MLRKKVTHRIPRPGARFYVCSLSPDVIVYKGQLTSDQVWAYFADLNVKSILLPFFLELFPHSIITIIFINREKNTRRIWHWYIHDFLPILFPAGNGLIPTVCWPITARLTLSEEMSTI